MSFKQRYLLEESKKSRKYTQDELERAAGKDFVFTDNPKDNLFSSLHPVKGDAVDMADLEHRSKILGIDKDFFEKHFAIRHGDDSGYHTDTEKLAGYASRLHPDKLNYWNTTGSPKRLTISALIGALSGAALSAMIPDLNARIKIHNNLKTGDFENIEFENPVINAGAAAIGALTTPFLNYLEYKRGQALYDRLNQNKTSGKRMT